MSAAWIKKANGSRLVNAVKAFICEEKDSPVCSPNSLLKPAPKFQIGGPSLSRRPFSAPTRARSTEERVLCTRVSSSETRPSIVNTCARADSSNCRDCSMESTTPCKRCKAGSGVSCSFADWSVARQAASSTFRCASSSSKLFASRVSSRASAER